MERREDELSKHLSCTNRVASAADGSGILQCNADARMAEVEREREYHNGKPMSFGSQAEWAYRRRFATHFLERGGSTFCAGDALYED